MQKPKNVKMHAAIPSDVASYLQERADENLSSPGVELRRLIVMGYKQALLQDQALESARVAAPAPTLSPVPIPAPVETAAPVAPATKGQETPLPQGKFRLHPCKEDTSPDGFKTFRFKLSDVCTYLGVPEKELRAHLDDDPQNFSRDLDEDSTLGGRSLRTKVLDLYPEQADELRRELVEDGYGLLFLNRQQFTALRKKGIEPCDMLNHV